MTEEKRDPEGVYGGEYTQDEYLIRYNLVISELNHTRNIAEFVSACSLLSKRAVEYGETEAFNLLSDLSEEAYNDFLRYLAFDYPQYREKLFSISIKYRLDRDRSGQLPYYRKFVDKSDSLF